MAELVENTTHDLMSDAKVWQAVEAVLEAAKHELEAAWTEIGYTDAEQKEFEVLERINAALGLVTRRVTR